MTSTVVLAGGTGFIGTYLADRFKALKYDVKMISRQEGHIQWGDRDGIAEALEGADMLIHLAGRSVDCRYNEKNKRDILTSRTETTKILGEAVMSSSRPPALWINSSTATIYRHAEDRPMTEENGEIGSGFSVDVAKAWEETFFSYDRKESGKETRLAALRIAIVLGQGGGVMTPYKNLARFGLGGPQGPGTQMFSWVHIEDIFGIIMFLKDHPELCGVFNCAAPEPLPNREWMREVRQAMKVPFGLPAPRWMLELGAVMIRTETELILKSRWVIPERLEQAGYKFKYRTAGQALELILLS